MLVEQEEFTEEVSNWKQSIGIDVSEKMENEDVFSLSIQATDNYIFIKDTAKKYIDAFNEIGNKKWQNFNSYGQLPDSASTTGLNKIWEFELLKLSKISNNKLAIFTYMNNMPDGCVTVNGIVVNSTSLDLSNFERAYNYLNMASATETQIRDFYNTTHTVSLAELGQICADIFQKGIMLYHTKWQLEENIKNATNLTELNECNFNG